ncbi:MAG: GNAT family N-acetyltransferase [Candidatus Nanopelagicales bacterium]
MLRGPVLVRGASASEVALMAPLWDEFCQQGGAAVAVPAGLDVGERIRERIEESDAAVAAGGRPTYRLVLAMDGSEPVGFASFSCVERGLLASGPVVVIDVVHVGSAQRKRGVGTQLLRAAVLFADEVGAADVVVNVPPAARDVNRFYARIGFSPMLLRRTAPLGQLRRRLGVDTRLDPRDATVDLTPVQRSLRRRVLLAPRRSATR